MGEKIKWTDDRLRLEALKYNNRGDFYRNSAYAYNTILKRGLWNLFCSHMVDSKLHFWTYEEVRKEALLYENRWSFQKNNRRAYVAAARMGVLEQICSHMIKMEISWTFEKIQQEALKYSSRREFEIKNKNAYQAAARYGFLDQVCQHMKRPRGTSLIEIELMSIIKKIYPTARKHRDTRVRIAGKPHIKGFDIDILVDKTGIEFDGTYWHSVKGLRKSRNRKFWPEEDLVSYHEIKDAWFASKGIKILHIEEIDWNENKESCIEKCLDFLGVSNEHKTA